MAKDDDAGPGALTYRQAAELLGCDANTIRIRTEKNKRYRMVPGSRRPARVYAREVYEDRAALLRKLSARELTENPHESATLKHAVTADRSMADEIASLRDKLARVSDAARVLLLSDSAKNDLIRQYLYDAFGGDDR